MDLIYYKDEKGNFGDDLNPYIFYNLLGDFNSYPEDIDFIGIGSILDEKFLCNKIRPNSKKIIFGSGVREFHFKIDNRKNYDIQFVRGPISAKVIGNVDYITDSAYLLKLLDKTQIFEKKYELSYIPYFKHVNLFNWDLFEKLTNIHVILPHKPIDIVIDEIKKSKKIISTAMHGAIVADIYRIPWVRGRMNTNIVESHLTTELKWYDWYNSIGFDTIRTINFNFSFTNCNFLNTISNTYKLILIAKSFYKQKKYNLSTDTIFKENIDKLETKIQFIKKQYKIYND
ncbi:MAG: polysaccharide pyruvyl transferase family protein [Flavobacteriales bacterium]|nr:polysaccharide pyruvyl transferase family protein [Flavobacteriales bacterium]